MYEKPALIYAGTAKSVILGITQFGADPDGHDFPWPFEFEQDMAFACKPENDPGSTATA